MYQVLFSFFNRFFPAHHLFKIGFNLSPMYRRSTAKVTSITPDFMEAIIRLPISYKNRNYVGAIFGGSMQAATDPIFMIQLLNILGNEYVVWDKAASIVYKKPAREVLYAKFSFANYEIEQIKNKVKEQQELDHKKIVTLTNKEGFVYAEVEKTLYIAQKDFYKKKLKTKNRKG